MRAGEPWDVANVKACVWATLDDGGKSFHSWDISWTLIVSQSTLFSLMSIYPRFARIDSSTCAPVWPAAEAS